MFTITGKYRKQDETATVFADDKIYIIPEDGKWSCIEMGEHIFGGPVLTKKLYEEMASGCKKSGTFMLVEQY